ncbi:MAG: BadF/BadG/BcrA/BcrD ATPase family protein [Bryobacteraceae bacterium]
MPSTEAKLFLGVDGGQSSTTALIGDAAGRVLGMGRGGPCNHISGPEAITRFHGAIGGAVAAACSAAGLAPEHRSFHAGCFGFSGGAEDKQKWVEQMFSFEHLFVTHDGLIALAGATGGRPGIIAISGTGSFTFGRNRAGTTARAGGWGYVFGDEGSGFDIVRQALRAALRMEEGWGPATQLHHRLLEATSAESANDLLHRFYTPDWPRSKAARLAPIVSDAALEGDGAAREIIHGAAQHLATFVGSVRRQLFQTGEPVRVAWIGGVFRGDMLRERFRMLVEMDEATTCAAPEYGPAAGALLEAYRIAGVTATLSNLPEMEK